MKTTYNYEGTVAANLVEDKDIVNDLTTLEKALFLENPAK